MIAGYYVRRVDCVSYIHVFNIVSMREWRFYTPARKKGERTWFCPGEWVERFRFRIPWHAFMVLISQENGGREHRKPFVIGCHR